MKKKSMQKLMGIAFSGMIAMTILMGCNSTSGEGSTGQQPQAGIEGGEQPNGRENPEFSNENGVYGKVTAIQEDSVTIALAERPERGERPEGEAPNGNPPEGKAQNESNLGQEPSENGEKPSGEPPEDMPEGGMDEITLTGEEQTIPVNGETVFTINREEGTLSDIKVDDTVTVTLNEDGSAAAIRIGMGGAPGGAGRNGTESEDASDSGNNEGIV